MPHPIPAQDFANVKGHAAGTLYVAPDGDVLLVRRANDGGNFQGYWALPGGGANEGEEPRQAADREAFEELGPRAREAGAPKLLDQRMGGDGQMAFHTFVRPAADKFVPDLNDEHDRYLWFPLNALPAPMHPGVRATMSERIGIAGDMTPEEWDGLISGFAKWASEEEAEAEHAEDHELLACDRMPLAMAGAPYREGIVIALDKASVRHIGIDGHLHVEVSNISKSCVNPYLGREIPKWRELGLEPERIYRLLRDPEELARGAATFNNLPVLSEHTPVTADKHPHELVVGSTGTDASFEAPYLRNSLVIWPRGGIDAVTSKAKRELSSAYRYRADMTPGTYEGEPYDGVMRDIVGNHVALVEEGRAGDDVVVGDSKEGIMAKPIILTRRASQLQGAIAFVALPLLAQDAKFNMTGTSAFAKVTAKALRDKPKEFAAAIHKEIAPMIAKDKKLSLDEVEKVIDLVNKYDDPAEKDAKDALEVDPDTGMPITRAEEASMDEGGAGMEFLAGVLTPEQLEQYKALMAGGGAADEPPPFKGKPEVGKGPNGATDEDPDDKKKKDEDKDAMGKDAVNKAIKDAVATATANALKEANAIRDAERALRPHVGDLNMSFDSAEQVLRHGLKLLGVKGHDTLPAALLSERLGMIPLPTRKAARDPALAQDSASADDFAKRHPHVNRIQVL